MVSGSMTLVSLVIAHAVWRLLVPYERLYGDPLILPRIEIGVCLFAIFAMAFFRALKWFSGGKSSD
jgi:hypothetical protein